MITQNIENILDTVSAEFDWPQPHRAKRFRTIDEIRKMNTRQGKFERSFLHYDWTDGDFEQDRIFEVDNSKAALLGRRDFWLSSPADIVQFKLDFAYYNALLKRTNGAVFRVGKKLA